MPSMNEKDYYAVLGVEQGATTEEIRRAFQQKARKLHPDVNKEPDAEERFKEVSEAYAVLSDDDKRRRYDAMRSGSPFSGGGYARPAGTASGDYEDPYGWGFPFGGNYTGRRTQASRSRAYNPRAGSDIIYELTLDDENAKKGTRRSVSYQRYAPCEACHGHGSVEHMHPVTCPTCGGSGRMAVDLSSLFGFGVIEMTCPECEGVGRVVEDPCSRCGGTGRTLSASEVVIDIPADTHDGDEVRLAGMGNAGTNGQTAGDFVCRMLLPTERVTAQQATALGIIGFGLPLILMVLATNGWRFSWTLSMILGLAFVVIGTAQMLQSGWSSNPRWLRNAAAAVGNGAIRGLFLVLIAAVPLVPSLALLLMLAFAYSMLGRMRR